MYSTYGHVSIVFSDKTQNIVFKATAFYILLMIFMVFLGMVNNWTVW